MTLSTHLQACSIMDRQYAATNISCNNVVTSSNKMYGETENSQWPFRGFVFNR